MDLEHLTEPAELIALLILRLTQDSDLVKIATGLSYVPRTFWATWPGRLEEVQLFQIRVKLKLREQLRPRWLESGEELFKRIVNSPHFLVFILDELPMLVSRMAQSDVYRDDARTVLRWLRKLRQAPESRNVRFVIAGSVGIDRVLSELGEEATIGDLERIRIEPFSPKVAAEFLGALATTHRVPLSQQSKHKILELIGTPIPYFLQIMFSAAAQVYRQDGEQITPSKVEQLYHDKVLGVDCRSFFEHHYGRLRDYYQPHEENAMKRILRELAAVGPLTRDACYQFYQIQNSNHADIEEFNRLMSDLENDFYIRFDAQERQYEFACKLLRDGWLRHYGTAGGKLPAPVGQGGQSSL